MATVQSMLTDIKLRYRHPYTDAQVIIWMNEQQFELFDMFEIDGPPYEFTTVANMNNYPIDTNLEIGKIKVMTFQISGDSYEEVEFRRNDDYIPADGGLWYTIVSDALYINYPGTMPDGRTVYIYADSTPTDIGTDLNVEPSTPKKYQEILKLGTLERIAAARKDIIMKNNFAADKEQKISDMQWNMKMNEPEWVTPADTRPHAGGRWRYGPVAIITQTGG